MNDLVTKRAEKLRPQIEEMLNEHYTITEISKEIKTNPRTTRRYIFVLGLEPNGNRGRTRIWDEEKIEKLKKLASEKKTGSEIALEIGVSPSEIYNQTHKLGLCLQKRKGVGEHVDEMADMYKNGKTLQEIGEAFGVTRERIRQLLVAHYPDMKREVNPPLRNAAVKETRTCPTCGTEFETSKSDPRKFCTHECSSIAKKRTMWTRDKAEVIMGLRQAGYTWSGIAEHFGYKRENGAPSFRTSLRRWAPILFTKKELKNLFGKRNTKKAKQA